METFLGCVPEKISQESVSKEGNAYLGNSTITPSARSTGRYFDERVNFGMIEFVGDGICKIGWQAVVFCVAVQVEEEDFMN